MNMCIYKFDTCPCTHTFEMPSNTHIRCETLVLDQRGIINVFKQMNTLYEEPISPMSSVSVTMIIFDFDHLQRIIATRYGL